VVSTLRSGLGLSPVISAKIHSKCASQPRIAKKNSLKTLFLGQRSRARLVDVAEIARFERGTQI